MAQSGCTCGANYGCSKSLLKSVGRHAQEHYPESSYGVYPIEEDTKIAIVLVANKYSPHNYW